MNTFELRSSNEVNTLTCYDFPSTDKFVKGVLQIVHGMNEYAARYADFIKYLNANGYAVVSYDQLGHGASIRNKDDLGFFSDEKGYEFLIQDVYKVNQRIRNMYPNVPVFVLGHSMGSMITRWYLMDYADTVDGYIMMGALGATSGAENTLNKVLLKTLRAIKGKRGRSSFVTNMAFKPYLKRVSDPVNSSAWLSRDKDICIKYNADPLCKFDFTIQGLIDILVMREYTNSSEWFEGVAKDLPIYIVSGQEDPCGEYGEAVKKIYDLLKPQATDLTLKLYPECRHEVLNELNKEEVYQDILSWLNKYCHKNIFVK